MPPINTGRSNTNQKGKSTGKRRVKRVRDSVKPTRVSSPDAVDRNAQAKKQEATRKVVAKMPARPTPSPDARDVRRSPAQKRRDAQVVAENIKVSRKKAVEKQKSVDDPGPVHLLPEYAKRRAASKAQTVARVAPILKVLDQTTRPIHAIAAGTDAAIQHRNVPKAALAGLKNEDKTTFSTVLKHAGVKNKYIRGGAGFALDVGLDPTTYLTGGTGAVARKSTLKAGEKAAAGAAEKAAPKGVTVKFAGKEVPAVKRATAKAGQGGGKALRKVVPERVRDTARNAASEVNPNVAPAGVDKATHEAARRVARKARAKTNQGQREAINLAHGIKKQIGEKNYTSVVDAVEAQDLSTLPEHLRGHAETLQGHLASIRKVQRDAGKKVPERKGYIPRKLTPETIKAENKRAAQVGGRGRSEPGSSKARKEQRTLAEVRETEPGRYREDLHALVAERMAEGTASAARANLAQDLAKLGHEVPRGSKVHLSPREALYRVKKGHDLVEVHPTDAKFLKPKPDGKGARYVVLNRSLVERTVGSVSPSRGGTILHGYDKAQGGFKRVALATPGFHIRNAIGDTAQAYVHQPGQKLPGNMVRAGRVLKAQGRLEKAQQRLAPPESSIKHGRDIQKRPVKRTRLQVQRLARKRDLGRGEYPEMARAASLEKHTGKPNSISVERAEFAGNKYGPAQHSSVYRYYDRTGRNVGWARLHSNGGRSVYVDPAARRQGIATKLYKRAEQDGYDIKNGGGGNTQTELGDVLNRSMNRSGGKLKTKRYGHVTYEEAAQKLIDAGAARSGYTSRELRDLSTSGDKKLKLPKSPAGVRRALLNREDLPRLATAIHALREGATYEEAAQKVAGAHFDYADLTPFERDVARRLMPFYTWTARNVPLQSKRLVTNPGKYAAYQKVRENATQITSPDAQDPQTRGLYKQLEAAGVNMRGGWEKYLTSYEQRNAGVPVSWKGRKFTISAGLPLADLNELPGLSGPGEYMNKAASLVTPLVKDPVEFLNNYSFFFRDQIERDNSPLVAAPSFVGRWPESVKRKIGVVKARDKRSGKMIWQWPGKADYVAHAVPGLPSQAVKMMTPGHDRQGKGAGAKALGIAGVKATPVDATSNAVNLAYARQQEIQKKLAGLRQQGWSAKNPNADYTRLSAQLKIVTQIAYQGKAKRGDAVLPTQGGPPKVRSSSGRVKVPGVTGRVKVPGAGGRVKVP